MKRVKVSQDVVHKAWRHWCVFHEDQGDLEESSYNYALWFDDFIDPVRQFYLWCGDVEVNEQSARRLELLAGPNFHAVLKANAERVECAKRSWGKRVHYDA